MAAALRELSTPTQRRQPAPPLTGICPAFLLCPQRSLLCFQSGCILPVHVKDTYASNSALFPAQKSLYPFPSAWEHAGLKGAFLYFPSFQFPSGVSLPFSSKIPAGKGQHSLSTNGLSPAKPTAVSFIPTTPPELPAEVSNGLHGVCPGVKCWSSLSFMHLTWLITLRLHPGPLWSSRTLCTLVLLLSHWLLPEESLLSFCSQPFPVVGSWGLHAWWSALTSVPSPRSSSRLFFPSLPIPATPPLSLCPCSG